MPRRSSSVAPRHLGRCRAFAEGSPRACACACACAAFLVCSDPVQRILPLFALAVLAALARWRSSPSPQMGARAAIFDALAVPVPSGPKRHPSNVQSAQPAGSGKGKREGEAGRGSGKREAAYRGAVSAMGSADSASRAIHAWQIELATLVHGATTMPSVPPRARTRRRKP